MENDKFQELVLKHLARMSDDIHLLKSDVSSLKDDYSSLKSDVSSLKGIAGRIETRMENEVIDKIRALFDGFKRHDEKLDRLDHKVNAVFELAGVHEVQIKLIKGN